MFYFFADNHYRTHAGRTIFEHLPEELRRNTEFFEDDWRELEKGGWTDKCDLLILHLIGGTCGVAHPGAGAESAVRRYCERGGNLLLLHGASAAFWAWPWWRSVTGLRWVRPDDPDGVAPSTHPHAPCKIVRAKCRHALIAELAEFDLPEDEIYTGLEQTAPLTVLLTAAVGGATWQQCCEARTPWGGRVVSFIPGHRPECVTVPELVADVAVLIQNLTRNERNS